MTNSFAKLCKTYGSVRTKDSYSEIGIQSWDPLWDPALSFKRLSKGLQIDVLDQ